MRLPRATTSGVVALAVLASCTTGRETMAQEGITMLSTAVGAGDAAQLPGFDDAVAASVTCFEAKPGKTATRRWTPPTPSSVRIVGYLRKPQSEASALFRVLVDGKTIWSRELGRADTIRHGFDILACDLTEDSTVEFAVSAGAEPVTVDTAFQVVPEPFVSRWRADLPTGHPQFGETAKGDLRKKGQAILQQIRDASANGTGRVMIPPGDYLFHAHWSHASTLKDLSDLEVVAKGVTFWFEPPMVHGLLFENCRNVTVRGLTIDFTLPCWFQARVTEVDHEKGTVQATLMAGYEPRNANGERETEGGRALMFYDAHGRFINHRHAPGRWRLTDEGAGVLCHDIGRHGIPAGLQPGDCVVGTIRTGAALRSVRCADMRFEDVNIWSSPGIAVNEGGGEGGHIYRRVRATRRPRTNRLQAFGADVFHLAGTDRGPTLDRCELAYGADDTLNIHGSFGRVVQRMDDRRYYLQGAFDVGDTIEFRDQRSVALLGIVKAVSAERTPDGPSLAINEKYRAKSEYLVELDKPLDLPPLAFVVLDGKRSAANFVLRNCWLHDDFQRALINGSPGGLIENNTFQNVGQGLCVQFETWGPWMEGPFARDLTIRGNRFLDAPPGGLAINVSMHPAGGGSNRRRFEAKPVTNMRIEGNTFACVGSPVLSIHNADGLRIHGNGVDAGTPDRRDWLYLQDCAGVSIEGNDCLSAREPQAGK